MGYLEAEREKLDIEDMVMMGLTRGRVKSCYLDKDMVVWKRNSGW